MVKKTNINNTSNKNNKTSNKVNNSNAERILREMREYEYELFKLENEYDAKRFELLMKYTPDDLKNCINEPKKYSTK